MLALRNPPMQVEKGMNLSQPAQAGFVILARGFNPVTTCKANTTYSGGQARRIIGVICALNACYMVAETLQNRA